MKRFWKQALIFFFSVVLVGLMTTPVVAANKTTLKVAFYPLDGFFEYDAQGNETGYGVELLERISRYTGLQFTYVKAESWESTKYMLLDGEADIRMPGTMPMETSKTLGYTQHSILDTYFAVLTRKSRTDLVYNDFNKFKSLKIGISSNLYQSTPVKNHLDQLQLSQDNLVFYESYNDCYEALQSGEVDALISNIMDLNDTMKLLARFSSRSNYISMTINNPYLDVLDDALYLIKTEDPTFFSNLYGKWFPERAMIPFTKEEIDFINSMDHMVFYFSDNQGYLSHQTQDGVYNGFCPALAKKICSNLGVKMQAYDAKSEQEAKTVILPDFYYDYTWAEERDAAITEPYATTSYYEIAKKGKQLDKQQAKVAAVKGFRVTRDYIQDGFSSDQMVWCNDYAECMEAVYSGKADLTYVSRYIAEYYLNFYRYVNLSATLTSYTHQVCFAVMGENKEIVASIINKSLLSISKEEIDAIIVQETSVKPEQNLVTEWFYQNPVRSVLYISMAAIVVVLFIGFLFVMQRTRKQNAALRKATHAKQDFLSHMSHDMRTPMNAIIGFSGFGVNSESLDQAREYHGKIQEASEYLLQLINDTLDLSKIEAGTVKLNPEPYPNVDFIASISNVLKPKADSKGVCFTIVNGLSNPATVLFDKLRLQQIFINLINNAIKFTPPGGHVTFRIDAVPEEDQKITTIFTVIDDGIGMTEAFQKKQLYKPFVQEHRIENAESGTGLGLSIVKELVSAMNGTMVCDSHPGKGTTFTVTLKTKIVASPAQQMPAPDAKTADLAGKVILVCEDHPLNREIIIKLLQNVKASVVNAENGQMGVDLFKQSEVGHFDAVLMDIRMPVLDGLEATKAIRSLNRADAKTIPIIAMTANAFDDDIELSLAAGMNAHLAKPLVPQTLYQTLLKFINNRR